MRQFAQIVFPPWVRTYPKSTSAEFFVPARTLIAIKKNGEISRKWCFRNFLLPLRYLVKNSFIVIATS